MRNIFKISKYSKYSKYSKFEQNLQIKITVKCDAQRFLKVFSSM